MTQQLSSYETLQSAGVEVILDDRDARPGVMFSEWEVVVYHQCPPSVSAA